MKIERAWLCDPTEGDDWKDMVDGRVYQVTNVRNLAIGDPGGEIVIEVFNKTAGVHRYNRLAFHRRFEFVSRGDQ